MDKISACLIVKNEEECIERCLSSLQGKVDEIIVVDTGSTDRTLEIMKAFEVNVYKFNWINDFSAARNYSLDKATGDWIFFIDADEELKTPDQKHLGELIHPYDSDIYVLKLLNLLGSEDNPSDVSRLNVMRIFRNLPENRFQGKIHEQVLFEGREVKIKQIEAEIIHHGYLEEVRNRKSKFERNVALLEKELKENPNDGFHWFNMGMEYLVDSDKRKALNCFQRSYELSNRSNAYFSRLLRNLAVCYLEESQIIEGHNICQEAITLYPDYTDIWYIKGLLLQSQSDYDQAIEMFEHALMLGDTIKYWSDHGTGSYKAIFKLGEIFLAQGKIEQGIAVYEMGAEAYPQVFAFYPELSKLYISRSEITKAAAILDQGSIYHPQLLPAAQRAKMIVAKLQSK
ncbi:glycosyltransferase [Brevibacillus brevis]|uniref:Glycosyltransferase n=1 Tax=Brevibacillus brevis TaxID=1393 RepID=A0ABY9T3M6_BREBE|nr:glycosyltransferase [Brevibacillus brevis]WNC14462.1 glycosyltransferase [Brevibacillus brevis]